MASTDNLADNTAFAEKNNASFPILADPEKTMSAAYGVLSPAGFAGRVTMYIDPDGVVARVDRNVNPQTAGADLVTALLSIGVPAAASDNPGGAGSTD